ncbi:MAG: UDP-glucose/GDP-mannose dehydrogenase family protein, partial [Promethearchaeota archaeon]
VKDIQISPSVKVVKLLQQLDATLKVYDPYYKGENIDDFTVFDSLDEALSGTKAVAVLTDHSEFIDIDFKKFMEKNGQLILIDARNIYNKSNLPVGTIYCGVGRPLQKI